MIEINLLYFTWRESRHINIRHQSNETSEKCKNNISMNCPVNITRICRVELTSWSDISLISSLTISWCLPLENISHFRRDTSANKNRVNSFDGRNTAPRFSAKRDFDGSRSFPPPPPGKIFSSEKLAYTRSRPRRNRASFNSHSDYLQLQIAANSFIIHSQRLSW